MMAPQAPDPEIPDLSRTSAEYDLLRHRQFTIRVGLFVGLAALIVGAIVAPYVTLLVFLALVCFGTVGVLTGRLSRMFIRWFDSLWSK